MTKLRNKFTEVNCGMCGECGERFDCYYLTFKLSGQYTAIRYDLCPVCWTKLGLPKVISKLEAEIKTKTKHAK